jgi:hypothetical protein
MTNNTPATQSAPCPACKQPAGQHYTPCSWFPAQPAPAPVLEGRYIVAGRPAIVTGYSSTTVYYTVEHADAEPTRHRTTRAAFGNPALVQTVA